MPKYLVTSGAHFTPFTYDELSKPLERMEQLHDAAQEAYDTLNLETSALENYISDNPDDRRARAMYDNYMDKLTTLQNNLWEHGVTAQTRRDLSAARAGYASDITRLSKAIQTRQERSKEYWDTRHKNPDMIMGDDPRLAGLDKYLDDDNYGKDYFSYSGESFMKEVGTDAAARANEMYRDPVIMKDPRLAGYLTRITQEGFTSDEVRNAGNAIRAALAGDNGLYTNLDPASKILADVFMNHLESTGARGKVSDTEFNRLVDYGLSGLSQAIGKRKYDDMRDLQWQEAMERNRWQWQQEYTAQQKAAAKQAEQEASLKLEDTHTESVTGPNAKKTERRLNRRGYNPTVSTLLFTNDGREIHNNVEASELVYGGDIRREAYKELGIDVGRTPNKSIEDRYLQGFVEKDGKIYRTRYNPHANGGEGAMEYSESGRKGSWTPSPHLTEKYNRARAQYLDNYNRYKDTEIGKIADIDPDKQFKDYDRYAIPFDTPLTGAMATAMDTPENGTHDYQTTTVARAGTDSGKYLERISSYISSGLRFDGDDALKAKDRRIYKGISSYVHPMTKYGTLERNPIKDPDDVFKFKDGIITNISEVKITPESIVDSLDGNVSGNGYIIVRLNDSDKEYAVGVDMFNSDLIYNIFAYGRQKLRGIDNDPYLSKANREQFKKECTAEVSYLLKSALGYSLNTQSQSGTSKDDTN